MEYDPMKPELESRTLRDRCVGFWRFLHTRVVSRLRIGWWRLLGANVDWTVLFYGKVYFTGRYSNLCLGRHVSVNPGVLFNASSTIWVGDFVNLSAFSQIHTAALDIGCRPPRPHRVEAVRIEDGVWIAAGVIVAPGARIRKDAVVGANSLVLGEVAEHCLYAGNPARKIRDLYAAIDSGANEEDRADSGWAPDAQ